MTVLARAIGWLVEPEAPAVAAPDEDVGAVARPHARNGVPEVVDGREAWALTSAAVLGRPGEVEPVAAGLALALARAARARAATVAVIGAPAHQPPGAAGSRAARRLAARLEAHGVPAGSAGRLAWASIPADGDVVAAARRAALVGAPAVLAVTSPRTAGVETALAEQDLLVIVASDPDGPLATLATATLPAVPAITTRPLSRGPSRALVRAGHYAPRGIRSAIATLPAAAEEPT